MTRDEYGSLLKELRNAGVISSQDFSVGFGGAVPYNGPSGKVLQIPRMDTMVSLISWSPASFSFYISMNFPSIYHFFLSLITV